MSSNKSSQVSLNIIEVSGQPRGSNSSLRSNANESENLSKSLILDTNEVSF
jgi:hypothetical protein